MAGLFRVIYFLALASALAILVIGGITNIYSGPSADNEFGSEFGGTLTSLFTNPEQEDYHRNLGIIFAILGSGIMGAAIIGFRAHQNALRCGLLAAGLITFWAAVGYASSGSSDWLVSVWALLTV